jgi:hypothetical protein
MRIQSILMHLICFCNYSIHIYSPCIMVTGLVAAFPNTTHCPLLKRIQLTSNTHDNNLEENIQILSQTWVSPHDLLTTGCHLLDGLFITRLQTHLVYTALATQNTTEDIFFNSHAQYPGKSKAIKFTRARVKNPLNYSLGDQKIPEASSCKYLGIILRNDLNWVDQVNYTARKAWKALNFVMHVLKKGNRNTKSLAYTSMVLPIREYGAACWDPYRECQINALDRVQRKAATFANLTNASDWDTLAQRRTVARLCALLKAYNGERAWKAIGAMLHRPYYLSRVDHVRKIWDRKQRTDIGKYSFVNRTIKIWNQLAAEVSGTLPCKPNTFSKRVRKAILNGVMRK